MMTPRIASLTACASILFTSGFIGAAIFVPSVIRPALQLLQALEHLGLHLLRLGQDLLWQGPRVIADDPAHPHLVLFDLLDMTARVDHLARGAKQQDA